MERRQCVFVFAEHLFKEFLAFAQSGEVYPTLRGICGKKIRAVTSAAADRTRHVFPNSRRSRQYRFSIRFQLDVPVSAGIRLYDQKFVKKAIQTIDKIRTFPGQSACFTPACRQTLIIHGIFPHLDILNMEQIRIQGIHAIHPITGAAVPLFVSDYVLMGYGTGIVMGVPGHDQRDWDFAKKFGLPIVEVVAGGDVTKEAFVAKDDSAVMVNSDFLNGMTVKEAIPFMKDWVEEKGIGRKKVNYKLRDWVFSRQRYWGEPIPLVHCDQCGWVPVPEDQLPLRLPEVESYEPTDNGESPLAKCTDWINTTCPCCGGPAQRETDTMPQWAGSSWYFLRYCDPHNDKALASKEALDYWTPVDWYNGGMEHTTLHLLYSRFWHKFLYDIGVVPTCEPYQKRTSHGMILGEGGEKMSKSRGNVVNTDDIVREYGADTMRLYEMFLGDFEKAAPWDPKAIKGCKRFLDRIWNLSENIKEGDAYSPENEALIHKTIKKVGEDADNLKANTAIAAMMGLLNQFEKAGCNKAEFLTFITILNPFAPHITEELNQLLGGKTMLAQAAWPVYDESKTVDHTVEIAVQLNGKVRSTITVSGDMTEEEIEKQALADPKIANAMQGMQVVKSIVIKKKIVNFVVKPL